MESEHYIAIFGGAVAGSEAAYQLNQKNINVVVFEQNTLPYGKIESGLPKWHHKLRDRQEGLIDERLSDPRIKFVPSVHLGKDLDIRDLSENWGFSAVLLATGAWRDRPLPIEGIDDYLDKGFYYQNALSDWFNNNHDPDYSKYDYHIPDGTIIIGGGLASIDVAKITMIESVRDALTKRNIQIDALTLEKKGVIPALEELGLNLEKLGLSGSTLVVRGGIVDMPLSPLPENPTEEEKQKAAEVRKKLVAKVTERFGFRIMEYRNAVDKIVVNGRLSGLVLKSTEHKEDKELYKVQTPLVISAIGSIPQPIPGLAQDGEIYRVKDLQTGELEGLKHVYALGNAVTGQGNIRRSQSHSRQVSEELFTSILAMDEADYEKMFEETASEATQKINTLFNLIEGGDRCTLSQIEAINAKIAELQKKVAYSGDYNEWVEAYRPIRLEDMIEEK